jgi:hypothetical protein
MCTVPDLTHKCDVRGNTQTPGRYHTGERLSQETYGKLSPRPPPTFDESESASPEKSQQSLAEDNNGKDLDASGKLSPNPANTFEESQTASTEESQQSPIQSNTPSKGMERDQSGSKAHSSKSPQATSTPRRLVSPLKSQNLSERSQTGMTGQSKSLSPVHEAPKMAGRNTEDECSMPTQMVSGAESSPGKHGSPCTESQQDMFDISPGSPTGTVLDPKVDIEDDNAHVIQYVQDSLAKISLLSKGTCKINIDSVMLGNKQLSNVVLYMRDAEREDIVLEKTSENQLVASLQNLKTLKSLEERLPEIHNAKNRKHRFPTPGTPVTLDLGNHHYVRGVLLGKAWSVRPKPCVYLMDYQKVVFLDSNTSLRYLNADHGESFLSVESALVKIPLSSFREPAQYEEMWLKWQRQLFPPGAVVRCLAASLPVTPNAGATLVMHGRLVDKDIGDGYKWRFRRDKEVHKDGNDITICWSVYNCHLDRCPALLDLQRKCIIIKYY